LSRTLEERGVVRREAHADDLRAAQISLTRVGAAMVRRIGPASEATYAEITDAIGAEDLERLYALLERIEERLAPHGS
jgi:DNA-binding MarR family transcriptional regulator